VVLQIASLKEILFVLKDKQHGGHVLNCRLLKITIAIDIIDSLHLLIPQDEVFQSADLSSYSRKELDKVTKDKN
jgi:alpha-acetolactate decarboxylase